MLEEARQACEQDFWNRTGEDKAGGATMQLVETWPCHRGKWQRGRPSGPRSPGKVNSSWCNPGEMKGGAGQLLVSALHCTLGARRRLGSWVAFR